MRHPVQAAPDAGSTRRNCDVRTPALLARTGGSNEPPHPSYAHRIPNTLVHLRQYVIDLACADPPAPDVTRKQSKRPVYDVLLRLATIGSAPSELRIVCKFLCTNWKRVWKNLHASAVPELIKSKWYTASHDLIPTNDRLASINLTDTPSCSSCGHLDYVQHRITKCGEGPTIWTWTKKILAVILRMDLLSSNLLSKMLKIKIYTRRTIILPVVLYGCET